jgi:hypothetical protein
MTWSLVDRHQGGKLEVVQVQVVWVRVHFISKPLPCYDERCQHIRVLHLFLAQAW